MSEIAHASGSIIDRGHRFATGLAETPADISRRGTVKANVQAIGLAGAIFGLVLGSFNMPDDSWWLAASYSAIKTPLLDAMTTLVCLPGHYVLTTVLKLRDDYAASIHAITAAQAAQSIALASLSPVLAFAYFCGVDHRLAVLIAGGLFAVAALTGFEVMRRRYAPLIQRRPRHRLMLAIWLAMYVFVGVQGGWMLRPFVGSPGAGVAFLRDEPLSNAYVVVWNLVSRQFVEVRHRN